MQNHELDCRGQACPHPVLKTKERLDQGEAPQLTVLVDNNAARENVSRFLERSGYEVQVADRGGAFAVTGTRGQKTAAGPAEEAWEEAAARKNLVLVGTDRLGTGDDVLAPLNGTPADVSIDAQPGPNCRDRLDRVRGFFSFHVGGANFLFADGSVRFVQRDIPQEIYQGLSTIEGGELVSGTE